MKLLALFAGLLSISVISSGQGVRFSVFADPQIAWFKPEARIIESAGARAGFDMGLEMDNFFSSNYAFSTGISLNRTGGKLRFNDSIPVRFESFSDTISPGDIVVYRLQYLNVPLGLKFTTREIGYTTIYVKLGLSGHFNIQAHADISERDIQNESLRDEVELFNLSYHFGGGIQYSLGGQTAIIAGLEYNHRFIDIATNDRFKVLLNSVSLRLGLLF